MNRSHLTKELKSGDIIPEIQLCPFGEVPATSLGGVEIMQRFDKEGLLQVVDNFEDEVRVDLDHRSEITNDTEAAGWIVGLRLDDERGLLGDIKLTSLGAKVLNDETYKFGSPAFDVDSKTGLPVRLTSFAFTNRPRIRDIEKIWNMAETAPVNNNNNIEGTLIMNEEEKKDVEEVVEETAEEVKEESPEVTEEVVEEKEEEKKEEVVNEGPSFVDDVKASLGLPAEAVEADIIATIEEWKKIIEGKQAEVIAEEAEAIVNELPIADENKEVVINFYKKDPETAKTVLNVFKSLPTQSLLNSEEAVRPDLNETSEKYSKIPGGKQRVDFLMKHKGKFI